jgi:hypothetical protein
MIASPGFVRQIVDGICALREKYGREAVDAASPWAIYYAIHDSVSPGFQHNRRVDLPDNPAFHEEARSMKDAHIATAIKAAIRKA